MSQLRLPIDLRTARTYRELLVGVSAPRVLICGSRSFGVSHIEVMKPELAALPPSTVVIHGGADGADSWGGAFAKQLGLSVVVFPAQWAKHGRGAGFKRNTEMLESGVNLVLAFWNGVSRGTADTLSKARRMGIPVRVVEFQ